MSLADPLLLLIALLLPLIWLRRRSARAAVRFSAAGRAGQIRDTWRVRLRWLPALLRL